MKKSVSLVKTKLEVDAKKLLVFNKYGSVCLHLVAILSLPMCQHDTISCLTDSMAQTITLPILNF